MCHLSAIYFIKRKIIGEVGCGSMSGQNGIIFKSLLSAYEQVSLLGAMRDTKMNKSRKARLTTINYCTRYKVALSINVLLMNALLPVF